MKKAEINYFLHNQTFSTIKVNSIENEYICNIAWSWITMGAVCKVKVINCFFSRELTCKVRFIAWPVVCANTKIFEFSPYFYSHFLLTFAAPLLLKIIFIPREYFASRVADPGY